MLTLTLMLMLDVVDEAHHRQPANNSEAEKMSEEEQHFQQQYGMNSSEFLRKLNEPSSRREYYSKPSTTKGAPERRGSV